MKTKPDHKLIKLIATNNTPFALDIILLNGYISNLNGTAEYTGLIYTNEWKIADLVADGFIFPFIQIVEKFTDHWNGNSHINGPITATAPIPTWADYVIALQNYADNMLGANAVVFSTDGVSIFSNSYRYDVDAIGAYN